MNQVEIKYESSWDHTWIKLRSHVNQFEISDNWKLCWPPPHPQIPYHPEGGFIGSTPPRYCHLLDCRSHQYCQRRRDLSASVPSSASASVSFCISVGGVGIAGLDGAVSTIAILPWLLSPLPLALVPFMLATQWRLEAWHTAQTAKNNDVCSLPYIQIHNVQVIKGTISKAAFLRTATFESISPARSHYF